MGSRQGTRVLRIFVGLVCAVSLVAFGEGEIFAPVALGANYVYWTNQVGYSLHPGSISFLSLDPTESRGNLGTTGATLFNPTAVTLDPPSGRFYWGNHAPGGISYANLNGSGGGDLHLGVATVNFPEGVAVDPAAGRIYWATDGAGKISLALFDGGGGGDDLGTDFATVSNPVGVAVDPLASRVYWGANGDISAISFASLVTPTGDNLYTDGASISFPAYPAILAAPSGTGAPTIGGGSAPGSTLACTDGRWSAGQVSSFFYRAPESFAHQWSRNGIDVPGANASTYVPGSIGDYGCRVTGRNESGSATQLGEVPQDVFQVGAAALMPRHANANLPVMVPDPGTVTLSGNQVVPRHVVSSTLTGAGTVKLLVKPRGSKKRKLNRTGRVKVTVTVSYQPDAGAGGSQMKTIGLRKSH